MIRFRRESRPKPDFSSRMPTARARKFGHFHAGRLQSTLTRSQNGEKCIKAKTLQNNARENGTFSTLFPTKLNVVRERRRRERENLNILRPTSAKYLDMLSKWENVHETKTQQNSARENGMFSTRFPTKMNLFRERRRRERENLDIFIPDVCKNTSHNGKTVYEN